MIQRRKTPRPLAGWTTAFPKQYSALRPARSPKKKSARCSKNFTRSKSFGRSSIRKIRPELASRKRRYNARVKVWLTEPGHRFCWVMIARLRAGEDVIQLPATQCHHRRGRILTKKGDLLFLEGEWTPVSAAGHAWNDTNRERARELGLLAPAGKYNTWPE